MIKPIETKSLRAELAAVVLSPITGIAVVCLCVWAVCTWPAELVGVGEWVRQWVLDVL